MIQGAYAKLNLAQLPFQIDPKVCPNTLFAIKQKVGILAHNPFNVSLHITYLNVTVNWDGVPDLGIPSMRFALANTKVDIHIPAAADREAEAYLCLDVTGALLSNLIKFLNAEGLSSGIPLVLYVSFSGTITGNANGFDVVLDYEQKRIPVTAVISLT